MTASRVRIRLLSLAPLFVLAAGCTVAAADAVTARLDVVRSSPAALEAAGVTAITGTYGSGCSGRSDAGTDPWTVSLSGASAPDELSVRRNDSTCVLTLGALVTDGGSYLATPAVALGTSYDGGESSAFSSNDAGVAFRGNAKISTASFADDFTIAVLVSDTPRASDGGRKTALRSAPDLQTAHTFAVLAATTVTNAGTGTTITGDLGVSPGTAITGLPPEQVIGSTYVGSDAVAVQAQADLTTLYDDLVGRGCVPANTLSDQDLSGLTLAPGVYCFATTAVLGPGTLTLDANGDPNAYWVFQIGSTLSVSASTVSVINGGSPCNVFWQVGSSATLLADALFAGNLVAFSSITLDANASISPGRALALNAAITMSTNQVSKAACP